MSIWLRILCVGVAGGFGAICRYLIIVAMKTPTLWMGLSTLVINTIGCFLIGVFAGWLAVCPWDYEHKQLLTMLGMTGFCGGFSTFSAFTLDSLRYFEAGHFSIWLIFGVCTVFFGLFGCAFGYWLGHRL